MPQICLEGVGKDYPMEHEKRVIHAVRDVDLAIEPGEFVFVTGSSGAGKSVLLKLIACEMQPTFGSVFVKGAAGPPAAVFWLCAPVLHTGP